MIELTPLKKWMKHCILKYIPNIRFEQALGTNTSQRIISTNLDSLILKLAEQTSTELDESDISILRKATKVLRKDCLQCKKSNIISFERSVTHDASETPSYLLKFLMCSLEVRDFDSMEAKCLTTANNILYSMVSDMQASYVTKQTQRGRQYDRNNHVIELLSAPNLGLSITHKQCLRWETRLANAVIDNMKENDNTYIPQSLVKGVIPLFHTDNINFIEVTPDGKGTTHALILSVYLTLFLLIWM